MSQSKSPSPAPRTRPASRFSKSTARADSQPETVPVTWLASMFGLAILCAALCAWGALCFMFWQGSWQLLYHPTSAVVRTPAGKNLPFDPVAFGAIATGQPSLRGWWIPAASPQGKGTLTALYFHGASGNMGDTVDMLVSLHNSGLNVLTFDYRGYGQSQFVHPSEARWNEDAESALAYLTGTRHIAPKAILLVGRDLGADLALEMAARHPELAGLVVLAPIASAANLIFRDPRARFVPARLLVKDRWQLRLPARLLKVPVLWFEWTVDPGTGPLPDRPEIFSQVASPRIFVWLIPTRDPDAAFSGAISAWMGDLAHQGRDLPPCMASSDITC
jgi:uncharacterized protein